MKHSPYLHLTGYEIDCYQSTWRCHNCDAQTSLGVTLLEESECPATGAPDWKAIDAAEHAAGFKRVLERMRKEKPAQGA